MLQAIDWGNVSRVAGSTDLFALDWASMTADQVEAELQVGCAPNHRVPEALASTQYCYSMPRLKTSSNWEGQALLSCKGCRVRGACHV